MLKHYAIHAFANFSLILGCVMVAAQAPAQAAKDYAALVAQAQADLDAGLISEARQKLDSTQKSQRGFEFDYLLARAEAAAEKGPAPDLVQTIAVPKVDTRYGLLNAVSQHLAFICRDGGVRIYDLRNPHEPEKLVKHEGGQAIWTGGFSLDGKTFVAGMGDGQVVVWDAQSWDRRFVAAVSKKPIRELAVAPDGSAFVAEGESAMELWSLAEAQPKKVGDVGERYNFGEGLAFSPTGELIATGGMFDIDLYDAKTAKQVRSMKHASYTMGLEFSPDGQHIASAPRGNVNKFLAVFDVAQGSLQFNVGPFPCYVHGGIFTSDSKRVVSTACERVPALQLFDAATGTMMFSMPRSETGTKPAVSRDGQILGWSESQGYQFIDLSRKPSAKQ